MKSMLQEASTVFKAVEKAWNNCGQPEGFSVKILEFGNKSFWGMTKNPAVISFSYDPKTQTRKASLDVNKSRFEKKSPTAHRVSRKQQNSISQKASDFISSVLGGSKDHKKDQDFSSRKNIQKKSVQPQQKREAFDKGWTKETADDVMVYLKELMSVMGINTELKYKIDQKLLNVYIDKRILRENEDEKLLFISLSHIVMQFLKRKHKKKFKHYYLIINSKSLAAAKPPVANG